MAATDTIWHAATAAAAPIFTATARSIQWKFSSISGGIFRVCETASIYCNIFHIIQMTLNYNDLFASPYRLQRAACTTWRMSDAINGNQSKQIST